MINVLLYGLAGIGALLVGLIAFLCLVGVYDRLIVLVSSKAKLAAENKQLRIEAGYDDWDDGWDGKI